MQLSRREFMRLAALAAGTAAAGSLIPAAQAAGCYDCHKISEPPYRKQSHRWLPSVCNVCRAQTGILCDVIYDQETGVKTVAKAAPNPNNPVGLANVSSDFIEHSGGGAAICPKGGSAVMTLYDPNRVKKPLIRRNPEKGKNIDPKFEEISWDEALSLISEKLKSARDSGEPEKLFWLADENNSQHIQQDFCNLYGTPNFYTQTSLYDSSRRAAYRLVMGDEPLIDGQTKYFLIFGWNPLSSFDQAYLPRVIMNGITVNEAKLVVIDPQLSFSASKSHEWIPIMPGTDAALALAIGHVIVYEKPFGETLYDERFVSDWTVGFEDYRAYIEDKTPEWAEKITGVPASTIRRIAVEFATTKPAVVYFGSGISQQSNGVQTGRAIAMLALLTGQVDRHGSLIIPNRQGNVHLPVSYELTHKKPDDGRFLFGQESLVYALSVISENALFRPKAGVIVGLNPVMTLPGTMNVIDALKMIDFLVVVDTHITETAELADIVLPGTTHFERLGLITSWVTWPVVSLRRQVIKPVFDQPTEYELMITLGKMLKLRDSEGRLFFDNLSYEDYLSRELENGAPHITLSDMIELPGAVWVDPNGTKYEKYLEEVHVPAGGRTDENGIIRSADGSPVGVVIKGNVYRGFNTPSRKLEFVSGSFRDRKDNEGNPIDPLPVYTQRTILPDKTYPLYLVEWKESTHYEASTQNNQWLLEIKNANPISINPVTAEELGFARGDVVVVESPYAKDRAVVRVTERIKPGVVGMMFGFGHWKLGDQAKGRGTNVAQFSPMKPDPISGNAVRKEICVRVYKE